VDVVVTIGSKTIGHSVDSRISVEILQKIAENEAQMTLDGYFVPILTKGEGYIGCLCPHYEIFMYPGKQVDIDKVNQPRTSSTSGIVPPPSKRLTPASVGSKYFDTVFSPGTTD
jgi:hypothetical protein